MQIKNALYKPRGMRRDDSYSSFNPEYSWSNHNIRLTARDNNDLLSITNEKGNLAVIINEYDNSLNNPVYHYDSTFSGYVNAIIPPVYHYTSSFLNYKNIFLLPEYNYQSIFSNYSNNLINT